MIVGKPWPMSGMRTKPKLILKSPARLSTLGLLMRQGKLDPFAIGYPTRINAKNVMPVAIALFQ